MARKAKEEAIAEPDDGRTPAERFEGLLKRVIAVPKAELDRRQKAYERFRRSVTRRALSKDAS